MTDRWQETAFIIAAMVCLAYLMGKGCEADRARSHDQSRLYMECIKRGVPLKDCP